MKTHLDETQFKLSIEQIQTIGEFGVYGAEELVIRIG
jgi:hypothetical protein